MPHVLNLTLPIKQDEVTREKLADLKRDFATKVQPAIDRALRASRKVHSARVVVIDGKYLQVLTVYDGDPREYTEFFRKELPEVFATLFGLAEAPPPQEDLLDPDAFFNFASSCQVSSLGESTEKLTGLGGQNEGYLFSAFGSRTVDEILGKVGG